MQRLHQYKKILKVRCESISEGKNASNFTFEVKFQQLQTHQVFRYTVIKHREEVAQFYQRLQLCIFDLSNPFNTSFISSRQKLLQSVNESLNQCNERLDVLTNHHFVSFFSIHLHYDDFINCLRHDNNKMQKQSEKKQEVSESYSFNKNTFCTEKPWIKSKTAEENEKPEEKMKEKIEENGRTKKHKEISEFERMVSLVGYQNESDIELQQTQVLDFTFVRYYDNQLLYVLEQPKKGTKIKNFFKNIFSQSIPEMGCLSIHRRVESKYLKTHSKELLAEPISMTFNQKTNMVFICTNVGVYIYLSKVQKKLEEIQIFSYVQLTRTIDFANNISKAQLYMLSQAERFQLYVYSINRQELQKTQYRYKRATAICYQESNSRLFVADCDSIQIYSVINFLQIKKIHEVKVQVAYQKLIENQGYLFGLSEKGLMTVFELKAQGKEKLISVTTTIDLPERTNKWVGSKKNKRLIITFYRNCLVLIDTIEGPLLSVQLNNESKVQSVFSDTEKGEVLTISPEGHLTTLKLDEAIR